MTIHHLFFICLALPFLTCQPVTDLAIPLEKGMIITQSVTIQKDTFRINGIDSLDQAILTIEGDNITVDFNNAVLIGSNDKNNPNEFYGLGVLIKNGRNIILKNANVHGFKVAIMAEGVDSLQILEGDFSYNYRQKLKSIREREDLSDWLSYHQNDKNEWLRYGMGIYLNQCHYALVKNVQITGGQNGLMLTQCNDGFFYNNSIHFNSGIGIGLYRSSRNQIMHNRLDWNVRGYSHGFYSRGQDSAGILAYEQSNENTFAYNSATHSGDGFFLWAGQTSMDTGEGGCNDNLIFGNDFSHAPTNGIEVTFSSNKIVKNILKECRYGVWGGYSWKTSILDNEIEDCDFGVAIEHGQNNEIYNNKFKNVNIGVQLWERKEQPKDWGYAAAKNVSSRNYNIYGNNFIKVAEAFDIRNTQNVVMDSAQQENKTIDFPPDLKIPDGMNAFLPEFHPRGRQYILVNEWGPYDFRYPVIWLRNIKGDQYTFLLLGPQGNWKAIGGKGLKNFRPKTGSFPATIVAEKDSTSDEISLDLEFIGEAITDQFGKSYSRGTAFPFSFYRYQKTLNWEVSWYEYDEKTDPLKNYEAFQKLKTQVAHHTETTTDLAYTWWRSPGGAINPDKFGTFAKTTFDIVPGKYHIQITSDDGLKFYLDGKLLIDHWDIHVPATDELIVDLKGSHTFEIEHFEGGGFSTLSFLLQPVK